MKNLQVSFGHSCLVVIFSALMACGPASSTHDESAKVTAETEATEDATEIEDTESSFPPYQTQSPFELDPDVAWEDSLRKYFTAEQIPIIKQARAEHEQVNSAAEFASFYLESLPAVAEILNTQIRKITPTEYSGDDSPKATWAWFTPYFPGLTTGLLCGECEFEALIDLGRMYYKVEQTPELEDDHFFQLTSEMYAENFPPKEHVDTDRWYKSVPGCVDCQASALGNGDRYYYIRLLERDAMARPLFAKEMDRYLDNILDVNWPRYFYPKEKVMAEIDQIKNSSVLTDDQKSALEYTKHDIAENYFNCGEEDCDWPESEF